MCKPGLQNQYSVTVSGPELTVDEGNDVVEEVGHEDPVDDSSTHEGEEG